MNPALMSVKKKTIRTCSLAGRLQHNDRLNQKTMKANRLTSAILVPMLWLIGVNRQQGEKNGY
jgi:hypothetical protein